MSKNLRDRLLDPKFQLRVLVIAAAVWHLAIASAIYEIGKHQLAPGEVYSTGIARVAADGLGYAPQCEELCLIMKSGGPGEWLTWPTQLHVRLYSLPLMLFIRWTGFNILTIEPLNLIYFLGMLALVFKLGAAVFDRTSGLLAAAIVGAWPSLLLHSTQLLRDPLLIVAVLALVWTLVELLRARLSWARATMLALVATAVLIIIRIVRLPMWSLTCVMIGIGLGLFVCRFLIRRRIDRKVIALGMVLIGLVVFIPRLQPWFHNQQETRQVRKIFPEEVQKLPIDQQVAARRSGFQYGIDPQGNVTRAEDASRIDRDVTFHGLKDMLLYTPRALVIGLFAPFPNMWFSAGKQTSARGRLLSGFEMLLTYVLECFALVGCWLGRRKLEAWFMISFAILGLLALGLVVSNVGALYRLRYPFWILIVILGTGGLVHLLRARFPGLKGAN